MREELVVLRKRPYRFDTMISAPFAVYQKTQEMKHQSSVIEALEDQGFVRAHVYGEYELWRRYV